MLARSDTPCPCGPASGARRQHRRVQQCGGRVKQRRPLRLVPQPARAQHAACACSRHRPRAPPAIVDHPHRQASVGGLQRRCHRPRWRDHRPGPRQSGRGGRHAPREVGRHRAVAHRRPPRREVRVRDHRHRHRPGCLAQQRRRVQQHRLHMLARGQGGEAARGRLQLRRRLGGPVERQPGLVQAQPGYGKRLRPLRQRAGRPQHREQHAHAGHRRRELQRVAPHPAHRVGAHQQQRRYPHAASSSGSGRGVSSCMSEKLRNCAR